MYVREVQKTLAMPGVEAEGSPAHQRLVSLVEAHRAVMVLFMQVLPCCRAHTRSVQDNSTRFHHDGTDHAACCLARDSAVSRAKSPSVCRSVRAACATCQSLASAR